MSRYIVEEIRLAIFMCSKTENDEFFTFTTLNYMKID